jgi:hypothetical protein
MRRPRLPDRSAALRLLSDALLLGSGIGAVVMAATRLRDRRRAPRPEQEPAYAGAPPLAQPAPAGTLPAGGQSRDLVPSPVDVQPGPEVGVDVQPDRPPAAAGEPPRRPARRISAPPAFRGAVVLRLTAAALALGAGVTAAVIAILLVRGVLA